MKIMKWLTVFVATASFGTGYTLAFTGNTPTDFPAEKISEISTDKDSYRVIIAGRINNLTPGRPKVITPIECANSEKKGNRHAVMADSTGCFRAEMPMPFAHDFTIYYNRNFYSAYAEPGDSIWLEIDAQHPDHMPLFKGDRADFNNQFSRANAKLFNSFHKMPEGPGESIEAFMREVRRLAAENDSVITDYSGRENLDPEVTRLLRNISRYALGSMITDLRNDEQVICDSVFRINDKEATKSYMLIPHLTPLVTQYGKEKDPDKIRQEIERKFEKSLLRDILFCKAYDDFDVTPEKDLFYSRAFYDYITSADSPAVIDTELPGNILSFDNGTANAIDLHTIADIIGQFKGHPIYVDIWATWCGPCRMAHKSLPELTGHFKDSDIVFLGIAMKSTPKLWEELVADLPANCRNYLVESDEASELVMSDLKMPGFPTYLMIDRDGTISTSTPPRPNEPEIYEYLSRFTRPKE